MTLAITSDNAAHGYNWTFAFPMLLFIVIAVTLYLVLTRPHKVPGHGRLRAAAGFATAAGGGAAEPAGAQLAASADAESGNVPDDEDQAAGAGPEADKPSTSGGPSTKDEASE